MSAQIQILIQAPPQDIGQMAGQEYCVLKVLSCLQLWVSTEGQDGGSSRTQVVTDLYKIVSLFYMRLGKIKAPTHALASESTMGKICPDQAVTREQGGRES